jgi:hypothetical protein
MPPLLLFIIFDYFAIDIFHAAAFDAIIIAILLAYFAATRDITLMLRHFRLSRPYFSSSLSLSFISLFHCR